MKMTKILAVVMAVLMMALCFAGCGEKKEATDMEYVKEKGKLVVGITDFAPMDYQDKDGNWIGFDADMAKAFAKYLGVQVEFVEINWDNKKMELDGKNIDCVWNGMTLTDEVLNGMETAKPYCKNQQVVVVKKDVADNYQTVDSVKALNFAVEKGSAGQKEAAAIEATYKEVVDQATALAEIKSGNADAAIIDSIMAGAMVGEGTDYADLTYTVGLSNEEYGVGFRKGSNLTNELNKFFKDYYASGKMTTLAEKYGVQAALIAQ